MLELWGLGDLALAIPFLREAGSRAQVTLLAKAHAAPILARFAPTVELFPLEAPWTAFKGKYRLHRWPWGKLLRTVRDLRRRRFDAAVSARHDPRDHLLLFLSGAGRRHGISRLGSGLWLTRNLPAPSPPHRANSWRSLASSFGWSLPDANPPLRPGRHIVIHSGAGQPVRRWPAERFAELAGRLRQAGWKVTQVDDSLADLDRLLDLLATADRFVGNDSGPGHLAALLGVPTFTIFGPQLPELFAPSHPGAAWIEGAPCRHKPCFDQCRYAEPHCIREISVDAVWQRLGAWLDITGRSH